MEHLSEEDTTFEKVFEKDRWELMRHLYYDGYILPLFMDYDTCLKYTKMKYNEELYHIMLKEGEKLSDGY